MKIDIMRLRSLVVAVLLCTPALAGASDPIEGKWLGHVGSEREKIEVGLEFRRNAAGALEVLLTQPISNYFGVADPGATVRREGDGIFVDAFALSLRLVGDRLEGTYPGPNSPASFARVRELPREAPIPEVPTGPGPRWQTRLNGQIWATPAVFEGVAYVGTTGGVFNALRLADGEFVWTFAAGRPIFGEALVTADAVYFTCDNGYLFRLDRATGKEIWRYDLGDGRAPRVLAHPVVFEWDWQGAKPVLADGSLFVGAGDGGFHAVEASTGRRRWRFDTSARIRNAAAVFDGKAGPRVAFGGADHLLHVLDRGTGQEIWRFDTGAEIDSAPVVHEDKLLVGTRGAALWALDLEKGERVWRTYFWGSWVESTPRVVDGVIYVGSSDLRRVSTLDPADGRVIWRSDVYGWTWGTPAVMADRLYVGAAGGRPYFLNHVASFSVLDRRTGRLLSRWPLPEVAGAHQWGIAGSPVVAGDLVVVATIDGGLLAFPL
jgi:outer membrane protein assembly factor BamB